VKKSEKKYKKVFSTFPDASADYLSLALEVFPDDLTQIFRERFGGVSGGASVGELESGSAT